MVPETPVAYLTRLFAPHLAEAKTGSAPERGYCGVAIQALVHESWSQLPPELRKHIPDHYRPLPFRTAGPSRFRGNEICDAWLDSEHFRIHYSTDPDHLPPGYPDLQSVRDLASHLETAYAFHRDVSGMGVALPDDDFGGGQDLVDCYFYDIDDVWGWAHGGGDAEGLCDNSQWGYMAVSTDFDFNDFSSQLRLTSEHEYYHLLQYAINLSQFSWFIESTARNSEFHVWPDIAAPRGSGEWMVRPYLSMWDGSGIRKYAPHFWFFLEAHHGWDFVTRIWNRCCSTRAELALVDELDALESDLDVALTDFALWNYFTGERDDGEHYDPDFGLPAVHHQAAHWEFPVPEAVLPENRIARAAGSNYIRFFGPASQNSLRLTLNGHADMVGQRAVTVLGVGHGGHRSWVLEPDQDGDVDFTVPDWGLFDFITLVVSNFWNAPQDSTSLHFTYAAEEVGQSPGTADSARLVMNSPNPFQSSTRIVFYHPGSVSAAIVGVYDLAGRRVRSLTDETAYPGFHQVVWDSRDENGRLAPAGMYLLRLESSADPHVRKVMLVR